MAGFIVYKKFTLKQAERCIAQLEKWFENNPKRKVCRTDLFEVRRDHVREEILKHTQHN